MNYEINWDKVKSLPEKERNEFMEFYSKSMNKVLKEKRNENVAHFFGLFIVILIPTIPTIAGILWLITLVFTTASFNWIFVLVISAIVSSLISAKTVW